MGVKGLWELLHPVARPIKLETLANKQLAIDASIWLHQFLRGMRDKEGQVIGNAHVLGFFRRICKLLYYNVKPIFVFDGGTPALKRMTILERRKRKRHDENMVKRTAEKLLAAQLRLRALEQRKAARKKKEQENQDKLNNVVHDSAENPKYLDDLTNNAAEPSIEDLEQEAAAVIAGSRAKKIKDKYVLPPMEVDFDTLAKIRSHDERFGYQPDDDVSSFLDEFKKESGIANIDSEVFKALPSEMQYEILHDIRLRSRVTSHERVQEMVRLSETPMDFSKLQVQGVIRRNTVTHKLLSVNQTVSKAEAATKPGRIASQRNRQYILVRNEEGGWVLGGKKPTSGVTADKPVQLDSDDEGDDKKAVKEEDEDGWESDNDDDDDIEFEEVTIPQVQQEPTLASGEPLRSPRRPSTRPRVIAPKHPTKPPVKKDEDSLLINLPEAYMDENESIEKVMAKFAEIEDEASWSQSSKRAVLQSRAFDGDDAERTNEKNGLKLAQHETGPDVAKLEDGPRQDSTKANLKPGSDMHWPETISDGEELDSLDTLNSDNTTDFTDLEDLVEDEETGEVLSRKEYNKKRRNSRVTDSSLDTSGQSPSGRALSIMEETRLGQEEFHEYWTGYTPDSFKIKNPDMYEFMLQEAIFDWDMDQLSSEVHSATRKLEKSSVNDTVGVESLQFWRSFLNSVIHWRQHQQQQIQQEEDNVHAISLTETPDVGQVTLGLDSQANDSTFGTHQPRTTTSAERKSRLSQYILADDDEEDEEDEEDETLTEIQETVAAPRNIVYCQDQAAVDTPREATVLTKRDVKEESEVTLSQPPVLDFSSSILKRRLPVEEPSKEAVIVESVKPSPAIESFAAPAVTLLENDEGIDLASAINSSGSDSGLGSLLSSPAPEGDAAQEPSMVNEEVELDAEAGKVLDDEEATVLKEQAEILAQLTADVKPADDAVEEGDEEEEEYEDEAHEADLQNEEQDFTNLFPDMANLPGAILLPKENTPPPPPTQKPEVGTGTNTPVLTAEEQEALKKQDAKRMFEESKKLESEIKVLQDQHRKHQRDADDLTESMVAETKMLLKLFGIPYIVAPMEAEAQCADLQLRGVVDGILTEDSDVFLFGGMRIFKNMFKEEKYVECYLMSDIERDLGVGRDRLVSLAYLLGSDYTTGVKGVGLVTAMEILRLFPKLENFAIWWRGEQLKQEGSQSKEGDGAGLGITDNGISSDDELGLGTIDEVALEKLAKQCRKIHLPSTFPDPHVADAYKRPMVDDDPTKFQWGIPDLDGLRDFLRKSLSWDRGEVDRVLLPIIRQMSSAQHQTQTTLDAFFDASVGTDFHYQQPVRKNLHKSARLRKVVNGLTGQKNSMSGAEDQGDVQAAAKKPKTPAKRKPTASGEQSKAGEEGGQQEGVDGEESSDSVEEVVVKSKKQRTASAAGRKTRTAQLKVPAAVTAAKRQLQSKDVEAKLAIRNRNRAAVAAAAAAALAGEKEVDAHATVVSKGVKRSNGSKAGSDANSSGSSSGEDDEQEDFAPSHWDILAQKQRQQQEYIQQHLQQQQSSPKKGTVSGAASSLSAMVSASNAARYGSSSFRNRETGQKDKATPPASPAKKRAVNKRAKAS
ncbi:DNA repair protein rad2 [Mortierella alpina]|nr:DNA repair protein rad2 [Mortierella alpina]